MWLHRSSCAKRGRQPSQGDYDETTTYFGKVRTPLYPISAGDLYRLCHGGPLVICRKLMQETAVHYQNKQYQVKCYKDSSRPLNLAAIQLKALVNLYGLIK